MNYPNYDKNMLALIASIEKHFKIATPHKSLPVLDKELKGCKKVVFMLIDGMGHYNMERVLNADGFLRKHEIMTLSTSFPSTTVSATSIACSGKAPIETGWLGWNQYFPQYNDSFIMFYSSSMYNKGQCPRNIENDLMRFEYVWEKVQQKGYYGKCIFPEFKTPGMKTFQDQCKLLSEFISDKDKEGYVYLYYDALDASMHNNGCYSDSTIQNMRDVETQIEAIAKLLDDDTVLIVSADHGHIDVEYMDIEEHPDLVNCLKFLPTLELRAMSFYVKDEMHEEFKALFNQYYGEYYTLMSHEEVFAKAMFGKGAPHPNVHAFVGDYMGLALTNKTIRIKYSGPEYGNHAGMSDDEMTTPLIIIKNKVNKPSNLNKLEDIKNAKNSMQHKNFTKIVGKKKDKSAFRRVNFNG